MKGTTAKEDPFVMKLYYTISEVARMVGVKEHEIRRWEKVFDGLNPKRTKVKRARRYTSNDIQLIRRISHLVKEEKYTMEGAKLKMESDDASIAATRK